jgi:hypothetical protein
VESWRAIGAVLRGWIIAQVCDALKFLSLFLAQLCGRRSGVARRKPETLDDLLGPILRDERFTEWCIANGMKPFSILRARKGSHRATGGTIAQIVAGLVAEQILPADGGPKNTARVAAACEASRAAAGK